ncbi:MAG: hypothetical protein V4441_11645 [Pseudomonadota bacterium]
MNINSSQMRQREIRLYDGRRLHLDFSLSFIIESDTRNHKFDFTWAVSGVDWSESLLTILTDLIQTHSVSYAYFCSYQVGRFVNDVLLQRTDPFSPLALTDLSDWVERYGVEVWRFMQAILNRWSKSNLPGLDPKIEIFLKQPTKWEQEGNEWYFALVANDPERGAFSEQELDNIHNEVNLAYQERRISTKEWALTCFLISTGVRPVQIARMKIEDVQIVPGPEGKEMTLLIPLAKKRSLGKQRWKRKAPTQLVEALLCPSSEHLALVL